MEHYSYKEMVQPDICEHTEGPLGSTHYSFKIPGSFLWLSLRQNRRAELATCTDDIAESRELSLSVGTVFRLVAPQRPLVSGVRTNDGLWITQDTHLLE